MVKKLFCVILGVTVLLMIAFQFFTTGSAVGGREEQEIQSTVEQALRIKYGWKKKAAIQDIATREFQEQIADSDFYEGLTFYTIERDFMKSHRKESGNIVTVSVTVYAPDIIIPIFTLEKMKDGKFLIVDVEYDI
ncbi:hypothetical protein D3Z38_07875 [Clostridiales bacterium]|nr:hypothetical protein [Clostridiales bacterium]